MKNHSAYILGIMLASNSIALAETSDPAEQARICRDSQQLRIQLREAV